MVFPVTHFPRTHPCTMLSVALRLPQEKHTLPAILLASQCAQHGLTSCNVQWQRAMHALISASFPQVVSTKASVYWVVTPEEVEQRMLSRNPNQRMSRIPGMYQLCNKVNLALLMRLVRHFDSCVY